MVQVLRLHLAHQKALTALVILRDQDCPVIQRYLAALEFLKDQLLLGRQVRQYFLKGRRFL